MEITADSLGIPPVRARSLTVALGDTTDLHSDLVMRADELDALERAFEITLPAEYRVTMLAYPFAPDGDAAQLDLWNSAAILHERNTLYRRTQLDSGPWPSNAFVIGEDGGEAAYVLNLSREPPVVQEFSFETKQFTDLTSDWAAWLSTLEKEEQWVAAHRRARAEAYRRKKWWQFWIRP